MLRRSIWILSALFLPIPSAALARQQGMSDAGAAAHQSAWSADNVRPAAAPAGRRQNYGLFRIGHISYELGVRTAQGRRDFNGNDTRTATMGTIMVGTQFSLLHLLRGSSRRLRITDYMRFDADVGWAWEKQSDIRPGMELDLASGGVAAFFSYGVGVQGSYLISKDLEVGGVIAKGTWNDELTFDSGNTLRDTSTPLIWIGRIRYGHLMGELHTGATPKSNWHVRHLINKNDKFAHRDTYSSYRIRYAPGGRMMIIGIDFDQHEFQVYRDEPSELLGRMASRSATSLRLVLGATH